MATDIFDQKILCRKCNSPMKKSEIYKNGFVFRAVVCSNGKCGEKIIHPADESEYNKFVNLKNKDFRVKMRMVGNSYAVSIPMEIVQFMNEQKRKMDEMVKLCFEDAGRLSLNFSNRDLDKNQNTRKQEIFNHSYFRKNPNERIIKAREVKILKNGKLVHARQFSDSAHPERNKTIIKKTKLKREIENDR